MLYLACIAAARRGLPYVVCTSPLLLRNPPPPLSPPPSPSAERSHPEFNEKSFTDATETAWARNKLCLVYIPGGKGGGSKAAKVDDAICKALADPEVSSKRTAPTVPPYIHIGLGLGLG